MGIGQRQGVKFTGNGDELVRPQDQRAHDRVLSLIGAVERRADRRSQNRFPVHLPLHYRLLKADSVDTQGSGHTIDLSSRSVSFTTEHELEIGALVKVSIDWPVALEGGVQLRLELKGRVVRSSRKRVVCSVENFEFRTRSASANAAGVKD
jgi:hypothetical protein